MNSPDQTNAAVPAAKPLAPAATAAAAAPALAPRTAANSQAAPVALPYQPTFESSPPSVGSLGILVDLFAAAIACAAAVLFFLLYIGSK